MAAQVAALLCMAVAGCYAPLKSEGISASALPDSFRTPFRTVGIPRNYAELAAPQPAVYRLGPGDKLDVTIPGLLGDTRDGMRPVRVEVMENGAIQLPLVGPVHVGGLGLAAAQQVVNDSYADGYLEDRRVTLHLFEKGTVSVVVLGAVNKPGTYLLPRYENDVARALASAEGLSDVAGNLIEVHRNPGSCEVAPFAAEPVSSSETPISPDALWPPRPTEPPQTIQQTSGRYPAPMPAQPRVLPPAAEPTFAPRAVPRTSNPYAAGRYGMAPQPVSSQVPVHPEPLHRDQAYAEPVHGPVVAPPHPAAQCPPGMPYPVGPANRDIVRIPLRGPFVKSIPPGECLLSAGDVVYVPAKMQEVFYVVGPLSRDSRTRFTIGDKEREIGSGFLLPPDREIDVITAVAMAGYIDPIESPTTVTLHRSHPGQPPLLVKVDLIEARKNARENLLVAPGDIIYLNPDPPWWFRRVFDQVIPTGLGIALGRAVSN